MNYYVKKYFVLSLLLMAPLIIAQTKNKVEQTENGIILDLQEFNYEFKDERRNNLVVRDYFQFTDPAEAGKFKLPYKEIVIAILPNTRPIIKILDKEEIVLTGVIPALNPNVKLENDSTLVFENTDYERIKSFSVEKELITSQKYILLRGVYCIQFRINSHLFDPQTNQLRFLNRIKIMLEYPSGIFPKTQDKSPARNRGEQIPAADSIFSDFIYNFENAKKYQTYSAPAVKDTTLDWIALNASYLKLSTASNSIFRITKKDLVDRGVIEQSVDPKTFRLYESGKEQPVYVRGEEDGTFDDDDYIEFIGGMNYPKRSHRIINSDNEEYNEYLNRYTDSLYFFLTWGNKTGERISIQKTNLAASDTLEYFNQTDHYEKNVMLQNLNTNEVTNQFPDWNKNKTWYWNWLFAQTSNYTFQIDNLYKNKLAKLFAKYVSGGSNVTANAHNLSLRLDGIRIDSQSVDRNKQVLLKGIVNSNSLKEGANQLLVTNANNGTNPNFLALDWYEIEYPKQLIAQNDSLIFIIDEALDRKIRAVKVKNVSTSNVVLYKVKPTFKRIESFQRVNSNLFFADTIGGNDQYLLIPGIKIKAPEFLYEKKFSNLRDNSRRADYIAITHDNFFNAALQYTGNISKMYNAATAVVNVKDIFDEFTFGYPYPEAVKSFLISTYKLWQTPKPKYVVLIGDANYDYKKFRYKNAGVIGGENFVPSFGFPISDNWFAVLDNDSVIPQMIVGRLPINTVDELALYNDKVKNNFENSFNDWNKKYLFFSGGRGTEGELKVLKNVNDTVINKYVEPAPVGGKVTHFYKTISPQTDFGPYTPQQFNSAIDEGAVVIPYLGHSGTATWDNGINEINQLKNKVNRNPLILDFGCSTNKFGEPDIVSFGERFILKNDGQAIGYIGNSSLGFLSTALIAPLKFFEILAAEPTLSLGEILLKTKIGLIGTYGSSSTNIIFALTGTLLGDPVVKMKMPLKPNLFIDQNSFLPQENYFSESNDSIQIKFAIQNLGRVEPKDYSIKFAQKFGGLTILEKNITRSLPLLSDSLVVWIKTKNYPGEHELELNLDVLNQIDEIYENDNAVKVKINVFSSALRDLFSNDFENSAENYITILNPVNFSSSQLNLRFEVSDNYDFQNPTVVNLPAGDLFTKISIQDLQTGKRFWFRYKINGAGSQFSKVKSFFNSNTPPFFLNDQYSFPAQKLENVIYSDGKVQLGIDTLKISATSAGWYAGANAVIAENGKNLLTNSFFAGMGLVVFDDKILRLEDSDWYELFNNPSRMKQLVDYINSIPQGKIVVLAVADDAANNISVELKNAIKSLGSTKIDSLQFRGSWALIGKKSAKPGDVIEKVKGPYDGLVQIEKVFIKQFTDGKLTTTKIGPASVWKKLLISANVSADSQLKIKPIAIDKNGKEDTLSVFQINNGAAELSSIDAKKYPYIKIITEFNSTQGYLPALKSLGVDYTSVPELGTNYQVISVSKDTVEQGEEVDLSFYLYNVGKSQAENFKVNIETVKKDNTREKIFETIVDSLGSEQKKIFSVPYSTASVTGPIQFNISIDSENKILELYKDNNFYSIPIYIKPNTKPASLKLTFDGDDIINGDYVSPNPNIRIELNDQSLIQIKDTSVVQLFLNNRKIYFSNNQSLAYSYSSSNPKFIIDYKPTLENGSYTLKILGKNAAGQLIDSTGLVRNFSVKKELQLLNVYSYPNPMKDETYFTFKLTQIPDEMRIKIYTLTGRMIKEFNLTSSELKYDFNKIYWDGRDTDGDLIANGVYLYKVILIKGSELSQTIQKLAVVR